MAKEITEEMVQNALDSGWSEVDARRGYGIFTADFGNGVEHIELINEMEAFNSDEEAAEQAEKDGIKIIRNLEFLDGHEGFYIDTPENREKLISVIKHDVPDDAVIIELNLCATGYYSGAEYEETLILTRDDFLKLFVANGLLVNDARGVEICCGELDGKHSEVYGCIFVTCWEQDKLENIKDSENTTNSGDFLFDTLTSEYSCMETFPNMSTHIEVAKMNKALVRAEEYVKKNKKYKTIHIKVPIEKEAEVREYIKNICLLYETYLKTE